MKIHVAVDVKSKKILSLNITDEHINDGKVLPKLVDDIVKSKNITVVGKIITDDAYTRVMRFINVFQKKDLPCIKVRRNARGKKTNHTLRNLPVISQRKNICKNGRITA